MLTFFIELLQICMAMREATDKSYQRQRMLSKSNVCISPESNLIRCCFFVVAFRTINNMKIYFVYVAFMLTTILAFWMPMMLLGWIRNHDKIRQIENSITTWNKKNMAKECQSHRKVLRAIGKYLRERWWKCKLLKAVKSWSVEEGNEKTICDSQ